MREVRSSSLLWLALAVPLAGTALVGCGGQSRASAGDDSNSTGGQSHFPGTGNGGLLESAGAGGSAGNAQAGVSGSVSAGGQPGASGAGPAVGGAAQTSLTFDSDGEDDGLSGGGASFFWGTTTGGFLGNWFLASADGESNDAPIDALEPPRGESTHACHVAGEEFADGADLMAQLRHPTNQPMDLTRYVGLTFWVRGVVAPSATAFVVMNDQPGRLLDEAAFAGLPSRAFTITDTWQKVSFPFAGLDSISAVVSIDFVVLDAGEAIDVWIDEVALECGGACQL